jgi:hypothetical protein
MKKYILQIIGAIALTVFGAIVGDFTSTIRSHRELTLYAQSDISVISRDPILGDIAVSFKNRTLSSLNKYTYVLKNTGNQLIGTEDIVSPVTLKFPKGATVIRIAIVKTQPESMKANLQLQGSDESAKLELALLNPGDWIEIAVYSEGQLPMPVVDGHIKGVKSIAIEDLRTTATNPKISRPWYYYLIAILAFLLFCLEFLVANQAIGYRRFKNRLKKNPDFILALPDVQALTHFVAVDMDFVDDEAKKKLFGFAANEKIPFEQRRDQVSIHIKQAALDSSSGTEIWFYLLLLILIGSAIYLVVSF